MNQIIPGYFMPIWHDVMLSKRIYATELLSLLTLIPLESLQSNGYIYRSKEEFLKDGVEGIGRINIYFDYKYCVIRVSKEYYKRLLLKDKSLDEDLDYGRTDNIRFLNISISFEDIDTLLSKEWKVGTLEDYLFLNVGLRYLKRIMSNNKKCTRLEELLLVLVADDVTSLKVYDDFNISGIVLKYVGNLNMDYWFRTYLEYIRYSRVVLELSN